MRRRPRARAAGTVRIGRRALIVGLATLVAPRPAATQTTSKLEGAKRVGVAAAGVGSDANYGAFLEGLGEFGWIDGRNVVIERRTDADPARRVDELLRHALDVLVVSGPIRTKHAMDRTKTIPIVAIDLESEPVASGFVRSLAQPGGNVTGIWLDMAELAGKALQILSEVVPRLTQLAVLWDDRIGGPQLAALEDAARKVGLGVRPVTLRERKDVDAAMRRVVGLKPDALVVLTAPPISGELPRVAEAALRARIPSASIFTDYPKVGGLVGYGPNQVDNYRRLAYFVDQILRGRHPAGLPVERPAKFELILNMKTAKALGLSISPSLLIRVDRVVE
jgi:putative ABC transport system substrate-binding protein